MIISHEDRSQKGENDGGKLEWTACRKVKKEASGWDRQAVGTECVARKDSVIKKDSTKLQACEIDN